MPKTKDRVATNAIQKELQAYAGTLKKVRITRSIPNDLTLNGFVLGVGREWVLLHQFHDFYPDGFALLRVKDVVEIRSGAYERHWERMLKKEGTMKQVPKRCEVPLQSTSSALNFLKTRRGNAIVECEDEKEAIEDFYIGRVLKVGKTLVDFANFDALGQWDKSAHKIQINEITKIQFDTPYARVFSKYLSGSPAAL